MIGPLHCLPSMANILLLSCVEFFGPARSAQAVQRMKRSWAHDCPPAKVYHPRQIVPFVVCDGFGGPARSALAVKRMKRSWAHDCPPPTVCHPRQIVPFVVCDGFGGPARSAQAEKCEKRALHGTTPPPPQVRGEGWMRPRNSSGATRPHSGAGTS